MKVEKALTPSLPPPPKTPEQLTERFAFPLVNDSNALR